MRGGYRDPNPGGEADQAFQFEDQFEDDGYGLLFRKFGRGRPVRVSFEERDECIERFERFNSHLQQAWVAGFIAWSIGILWWTHNDPWSQAYLFAGLVMIAAASRVAQRLAWKRIVSKFERRTPVGPERTLVDQYRSRAARLSWSTVAFALVGGGIAVWLADFAHPWRLLEHAQTTLALAGVLALGLLKVFDQRR